MSLSTTGNQFVVGEGGREFNFTGIDGKSYRLLTSGRLTIDARVKGFKSPDTSGFDKVTIDTGDHKVEVSHEAILIDGKPPTEDHKRAGDYVWVESDRVTVGADGWLFGVVLDKGTSPAHSKGALKNREHVSLFAYPPVPSGSSGVLVDGHHGCDHQPFESEGK